MGEPTKSENAHENVSSVTSRWDRTVFLTLTCTAILTRLYKIDQPEHVCWDETHFGKMASWYINGTFFFDVHPPLGKMLLGLAGVLTGYNGSFPFSKPGDAYEDTPYLGMRIFCALLGSAVIPFTYSIVYEITNRQIPSILSASLVLCDTGVLTLSQYILLDPLLMCFIMAATFCLVKFNKLKHIPFTSIWWFWLACTGIFLACSIGVKFVGLFVILLAGFSTVKDLLDLFSDVTLKISYIVRHLLARILCLILLPVILYLVFFWIHFVLLYKSGSGDGFFSSAFQSRLEGNSLHRANMPQDIAYGSVVTIKNHRIAGAYLHSHWHLYPEGLGAKQQQVTTYAHKDENNKWIFKKYDINPNENDTVEYIKNGDLVRLEHVETRRNLHSHKDMAPVTKRHYQVTCYGDNGTGDANDIFRVEINDKNNEGKLKTVKSVFRLVHLYMGCVLHSHNKKLPKWGWEQLEVTCNPKARDKKSLWNIEEVIDPRLPNTSFDIYAPSFIEKFIETHAVMLQGNSGLKPKDGEVTSQPWQWVVNYRGQPFSGPDFRVYLLGNPVIFWLNIATVILYILLVPAFLIKKQRYHEHWRYDSIKYSLVSGGTFLFFAWMLHFVPFWFMTRVLYFHHYFPAFLYNCMLTGVVLDFIMCTCLNVKNNEISYSVLALIIALVFYSFIQFSPLSYGMTGPVAVNSESVMYGLKWLDSWDI